MADEKQVFEGAILPPKLAGVISPSDALVALKSIVDMVQTHQVESTQREKLRAYRDAEVQRIKSAEAVLRHYFDRTFEERVETNRRLFDSLDSALRAGDHSAVQSVVAGIVEVARTSPLAQMGDLGALRRAMDDPDTVFEF